MNVQEGPILLCVNVNDTDVFKRSIVNTNEIIVMPKGRLTKLTLIWY